MTSSQASLSEGGSAVLDEPLPPVELARRLRGTPAPSPGTCAHCATGLVARARHGRQVLYRRSSLGDHLMTGVGATGRARA
ncbi:hypothetical protein [Streptomyces sp. TRM68367]|uniref:hypothetical protein n=1 Tax=Streptomyces sp. TRM68367 TaxID=2758415 RepID=UPI001CA9AE9F|nr:hypothetical protein [Streptomyces sp. TRM68367]